MIEIEKDEDAPVTPNCKTFLIQVGKGYERKVQGEEIKETDLPPTVTCLQGRGQNKPHIGICS